MPTPMNAAEARDVLGVGQGASQEEIRRAWRGLALKSHPDKHPDDVDAAARFRLVTDAYKALAAGEVAYKSHAELCAEMEETRQALMRAMELNSRLDQGGPAEGGGGAVGSSNERLLKIGAATWIGEVSGGRPHGQGDLLLPNGAVHNGAFEAGRASGVGVLYEASGSVLRGQWVENKQVGPFETTDPKGGTWHDVYDAEGKRTSRKKGAPPPSAAAAAVVCKYCGVKFHATLKAQRCMQHSGKWLEAPTHNADGSEARVDKAAFPEGGLWLCCGSKSKTADRGCTIGTHAPVDAPPPVPEGRRIEDITDGAAVDAAPPPAAEKPAEKPAVQSAAATIGGYLSCMRAKLKASGKGEQNCEMLLCSRVDGSLHFEDFGGWALRNESMRRMLRELDAAGALTDFPLLLIQTGDRCVAKRAGSGIELHLWQSQPVSDDLRARIPLHRTLSMCSSPKYADVPIPDWCFDTWPEAGVPLGGFDDACAALAAAAVQPPTDGMMLSWAGTAHHHPSRMQLVRLAAEHPNRLAVNNVVDRPKDASGGDGGGTARAQYRSLIEQVTRCAYLLDVQGKGYSSRLKLLLHSGRTVFIAARPWQEYYQTALVPFTHYVPVKEDMSDLMQRLDWADANPAEAAAIATNAQRFARTHLTRASAMRALRAAILSTTPDGSAALVKGAAWRATADRETAVPSFVESSFTTKVEYEAWRRSLAS